MRYTVLMFLLLSITCLSAQDSDSTDQQAKKLKKNLHYYFSRDTSAHIKSVRFNFQLDFRNSFVRDFPIDIYGGNFGFVLHRKFRIGAGYYFFSQHFSNQLLGLRPSNGIPYTDKKGVPIPVGKLTNKQPYIPASQNLAVNYGCLNFTYMFFNSRLVNLYIPLEIGYGTFSEKLVDPSGYDFKTLPKSPKASTGRFWPGQVGLMAVTKVHRLVYVLTAIGYRKTLHQKFETESDFTDFESQFESYYYRLGLQIQISSILKKRFRKK